MTITLLIQNETGKELERVEALESLDQDGGKVVMLLSAAMILIFLAGNLLHRYEVSFIPESLVVVLIGACIGLVLPTDSWNGTDSWWKLTGFSIDQEGLINKLVLDVILLPIILFEAGWSLRHRDFMSQLPYTLVFAVFGTLISMGVVGGLILATSDLHGVSNPQVAFAFASLLSSVDPVATLATYNALNVDPLLNAVVFGESCLNDAVAIVLFQILNKTPPAQFENMSAASITGTITLGVLQFLVLGILLGLALGAVFCLLLRFTKMGHLTHMAPLLILTSAFFGYNFSESVCKQSGIITNLFMAMLMGGYAPAHLTAEGALMTSFLLKQVSSLADTFVFLFIGIAVVYVQVNGLTFGLWILLFCLVGRFVGTVPLGILTNGVKNRVLKNRPLEKRHLLSWRHIFMMWHAGLRGGIALMLTLDLGDWVDEVNGIGSKERLRNATLVAICGFLLVSGGTTKLFLTLLEIPMGGDAGSLPRYAGTSKVFRKRINQCVRPILVGCDASSLVSGEDCEEGHVIEGVFADLFASRQRQQQEEHDGEAPGLESIADDELDARPPSPPLITRRASASSAGWAGDRYRMFGTIDPCHFDEVFDNRPPAAAPAPASNAPASRSRLIRQAPSKGDVSADGDGSSSSSAETISESDEEHRE